MLIAHALDLKIVNDEGEEDGAGCMAPEAISVADWGMSVGLKVGDKAFVGKLTSLEKAVHAFLGFYNNVAVVDEGRGATLYCCMIQSGLAQTGMHMCS